MKFTFLWVRIHHMPKVWSLFGLHPNRSSSYAPKNLALWRLFTKLTKAFPYGCLHSCNNTWVYYIISSLHKMCYYKTWWWSNNIKIWKEKWAQNSTQRKNGWFIHPFCLTLSKPKKKIQIYLASPSQEFQFFVPTEVKLTDYYLCLT